ncbi:hypothetical protein D3C80_2043950 [compost metagenome]
MQVAMPRCGNDVAFDATDQPGRCAQRSQLLFPERFAACQILGLEPADVLGITPTRCFRHLPAVALQHFAQ